MTKKERELEKQLDAARRLAGAQLIKIEHLKRRVATLEKKLRKALEYT